MERRIRLAYLTEDLLREPHDVYAVDPHVPSYRKEVDLVRIAAERVAWGQKARVLPAPSVLLVEIDSTEPAQFRQLVEMVATAREPKEPASY